MTQRAFVESRTEMEEILREEGLGFLGLSDKTGPYIVPLNYAYVEDSIVFHCALEGRKLDCIRAQPAVCFTVARQTGEVRSHFGTACHDENDSVICIGRARIVEDPAEKARLLNALNRHFNPQEVDIAPQRVASCAVVQIRIAEMTGRRERKRKAIYWRYRF